MIYAATSRSDPTADQQQSVQTQPQLQVAGKNAHLVQHSAQEQQQQQQPGLLNWPVGSPYHWIVRDSGCVLLQLLLLFLSLLLISMLDGLLLRYNSCFFCSLDYYYAMLLLLLQGCPRGPRQQGVMRTRVADLTFHVQV
jgi:hypothetical protein